VVGWDPDDLGPGQLRRERRAFLIESTMKVALAGQLLSIFLFVAVADRLHTLLSGAMCAAGTLNASPLGYPTLAIKLVGFLFCGLWLVVHRASPVAASSDLVRVKHLSLAGLATLLTAENATQLRYFAALEPDAITSCCATLFHPRAEGLAADLAAFPAGPSRVGFFVLLGLTVMAGLHARLRSASPVAFALLAVLLAGAAVVAVVSWVAPGYYRLPTHHCPFCLLSSRTGFIGYPLYALLGLGVVSGMGSGVVRGLRALDRRGSIRAGAELRLCSVSMTSFVLFAALAVWPMVAGNLRMEGF